MSSEICDTSVLLILLCRIFGFPMQEKSHAVEDLVLHEEGQQSVFYPKDATPAKMAEIAAKRFVFYIFYYNKILIFSARTKLTEFFELCKKGVVGWNGKEEKSAKELLYYECPQYFTWDKNKRIWKKRKGIIFYNFVYFNQLNFLIGKV